MTSYLVKQPCVRISGVYLTDEEQRRKEYMRSKEQWMNKQKNFIACSKADDEKSYIKNYVARDPSEAPVLHKFRSEDKSKFIAGPFIY